MPFLYPIYTVFAPSAKGKNALYYNKKEKGDLMYGYGYSPQSYYDMLRAQMFAQQAPPQPTAQAANVLPPQQVPQIEGRKSIDNLKMSPNSSVLLLDKTAPIVWLCVSDGLGSITATAYDISLHQDVPPFDVAGFAGDVEKRLQALEKFFSEVNRDDGKSDVADARGGKTNEWSSGKTK